MAISKKSKLSSLFATGLTSCCSLLVMAPLSMAFAEEGDDDVVVDEEIVAVGSHIRGAKTTGTLPVTSLGKADLDSIGSVTTDELIAALPQSGAQNFTGESAGPNSARGDVSSVNLRGLGSGNTLALLNGRRMVLHPTTQSENSIPVQIVNINAIPGSAIERIEVLRDGAGPIYGADATAGVLNHVIDGDYEGLKIGLRYGQSDGTSLDETSFDFKWGTTFNEGATNLTIAGSIYDRSASLRSERIYTASNDRRPIAPEPFNASSRFNNNSSDSPWLQFDPRDANGDRISVTVGDVSANRFHTRPCDGSANDLAQLGNGVCLGEGSLPTSLRFDEGSFGTLTPESERFNIFASVTHELESGAEFFGELNYYDASSSATRGGSGILASGTIAVGENNPFNPFGSGAGRLAGLDVNEVPLTGIRSTSENYRVFEVGGRTIDVDSDIYRVLGGFRGEFDDWSWEFAGLYSEANTVDVEGNRTRTSALQAALNSADPATAYNPFNGGDLNNPQTADTTLNTNVADALRVDATRDSTATLALFDYKLSNPELFTLREQPVGAAFGFEWRREEVSDDRDALIDGSNPIINGVGVASDSDVANTNPTPDYEGSRQVFSAYGELQGSLISVDDEIPLVQALDFQLAARYESFSDIQDEVLVPKLGLSWEVNDWLMFRGAYTEGFRAPNLETTNQTAIVREAENLRDIQACLDQNIINSVSDFANCTIEVNVTDTRGGNPNLKPEDSESTTWGFVLRPWEGMTFTTDFWRIEQTGIVGAITTQSQLDIDAVLRSQNSFNPNVTRDPVTGLAVSTFSGFVNLNTRNIKGFDVSLTQDFDTDAGLFRLKTDWSFVSEFTQVGGSETQGLADAGISTNNAGSLIRDEENPYSRGAASVQWNNNQWGASLFARYIGRVEDPDLRATIDGVSVAYVVDDYVEVNGSVNYRFENDGFLNQSTLKVGINNMFDEEPPLADEVTGYIRELHTSKGRYFYVSLVKEFD
ncbi:TonB-dependent receptor domain-containing protein [Porticoccus sp. GXU_MW_L64]